jgi:putative transcriptional regulator
MLARLLAAFFVVALALGFGQADKLTPGTFLVASRDLGDPNFAHTVVLLVRYDEDNGALGLIINRPSDVPLSRVFAELKEAKDRADPVYLGGPVETGSVLALLKSDVKPKDANRVFGDVYLISSKALLEKTLASGTEAERFHAYLGYAGWAREQLEHEVDLGAWHVMPAEAASVFHSDPDSVWPRLIRRTEMRIARRAPLPYQPVQRDLPVVNH